jgi:hypothetical protein
VQRAHPAVQWLTDGALGDQRLHLLDRRIGQPVLEQLQMPASALSGVDHPLALVDAHRHQLLHRNLQAPRKRRLGHRHMHRMRRQDFDHVEVVL